MSKQILKIHISWKNDRTVYIDTDASMSKEEIELYVALLKESVNRVLAEYNQYESEEDNTVCNFLAEGDDNLFPLPPQPHCTVTNIGQPYNVSVEWNANDSDFEEWEFPES